MIKPLSLTLLFASLLAAPADSTPPTDLHTHPHRAGRAAADSDREGHLYVVTASWGNTQLALRTGDGRGGLHLPRHFCPTRHRPYARLRTADFNHDGHPDIVTTNLDDGT